MWAKSCTPPDPEMTRWHWISGFINLFGLPIKVQAMVDGK
jgi:hypothetical protein